MSFRSQTLLGKDTIEEDNSDSFNVEDPNDLLQQKKKEQVRRQMSGRDQLEAVLEEKAGSSKILVNFKKAFLKSQIPQQIGALNVSDCERDARSNTKSRPEDQENDATRKTNTAESSYRASAKQRPKSQFSRQ